MKNVGKYTNLMDPMEMNSFDTVPDLFLLYTASSPPKLDLSMWDKHVKLSNYQLTSLISKLSTVWNDIIEGVFAVLFTLRFQNAQNLKILANRSWLSELRIANRKIIWTFKMSFQVKREIGPVLEC